MVNASRI